MRRSFRTWLVIRPPSARPAAWRVAISLASVGVATLVAIWLAPLSYRAPFLFFFPATILVAWFGGFRTGVSCAVVASLAANHFLLPPYGRFSFDVSSLILTVLFGLTFASVCWLAELAHRQLGSKEEELRQLSAIADSTEEAIIGKTLTGSITSWNHGAELLYGYTSAGHLEREPLCVACLLKNGLLDGRKPLRRISQPSMVQAPTLHRWLRHKRLR